MNMICISIVFALFSQFVEPHYPTTLVYPPFGHCMGIYRAGTEQLAMLLGGLVRFNNPQGLACVKLEAWDGPGTSDDDELAVYGVNSGSGHIIYNADMYTLGLYGGEGSGNDQLMTPHGIAATPSGMVLVADTGNKRVVVLQRDGSRLVFQDTLSGSLQSPWDVAVDDGGLYVTDREAGLLYIYDSVEDTLPDEVQLESPTGVNSVAGGRWFHSEESFTAVVTGSGSSLTKIVDGEVSAETDTSRFPGLILNYPAIDFWGNIWVTDSLSCCVHKFNQSLEYLGSFGTRGHGDRELWYPTGIAIWKRYGQVFIAEREGARYFWIGTDIIDLSTETTPRSITISGRLTEDSSINGLIYDEDGEPVARVAEGRYDAGPLEIVWDGMEERQNPLPAGDYMIELQLQPLYSSKGYFSKTITHEFTLEAPELERPGPALSSSNRGCDS